MLTVQLPKTREELIELEKIEQERLGISDDTLAAIKQFFLKTSVPRIIEEKRKKRE